jgi:hypothetical protein
MRYLGNTLRLAIDCCQEQALAEPVDMMVEDVGYSAGAAIKHEDGSYKFYSCPLHTAQYKLKLLERCCGWVDV